MIILKLLPRFTLARESNIMDMLNPILELTSQTLELMDDILRGPKPCNKKWTTTLSQL